jgi:DNA-binding transcriptional MocR family regulator
MLSLTISHKSGQPLADQIVAGIKRQIDDHHLRPGSKLPSIRTFVDSQKVSRFTVVEAYDRLVAMGYLHSRRGAGFYTAAAPVAPDGPRPVASDAHKRNEELVWLVRRLLEANENTLLAGGPWLPNSWLDEAGIRQSLNVLARKNGAYLLEYGHPFGYLPLREHLALMLAGLGITARIGQILLPQGTSQALELVIRYLLKPGDAALVDDPGYYNMFGNLRLQGVEMLAVPRNRDGPDVAILEKLAATHRPKAYFTQSVMQNPTGTNMSPHIAFKVLQAAERHNFIVVEDDIFCDLQVKTTPRLATLDQLNRVIYARSFSKTLSGSLRVGFLACAQGIVEELADIKMLTSITTSQFTERLVYLMLVDGHYRKYLSRLHERLGEARLNVVGALSASEWRCSSSRRTACSCGHASRTSTIRWLWRRPPEVTASCWLPAPCSVPISSARHGCALTSPPARTRASSNGCNGWRLQRDAARVLSEQRLESSSLPTWRVGPPG